MISTGILDFALIFGPLVFLVFWLRYKHQRRLAQIERDGLPPIRPLGPEPPPRAGLFTPLLRCFPEPQRQYLAEQLALALAGFLVMGWPCTVLLTTVLLPAAVADHTTLGTASFNVWYAYTQNVTLVSLVALAPAVITGLLASGLFLLGPQGTFYQTRPLTRRFIFWSRILPAVGALIAAVAIGIVISLGVLLVFYGPVWHQLTSSYQGTGPLRAITVMPVQGVQHAPVHREAYQFLTLVNTSVPRLCLSLLTRMLLIFSLCVALALQPSRWLARKRLGFGGVLVVILIGAVGGNIGGLMNDLSRHPVLRDWLFLYNRLGSPPPWSHALVPLLLTAALLLLGQGLFLRHEL